MEIRQEGQWGNCQGNPAKSCPSRWEPSQQRPEGIFDICWPVKARATVIGELRLWTWARHS
eukprot:5232898-Pyramimonas_sp.AAC.1